MQVKRSGIGFKLSRIYTPVRDLYRSNLKFRIGLIMFIAILAFGSLSIFSPENYKYWYSLPKDREPSLESIDMVLGTTSNGRSVLWSLTNGIVNSLIIALITALVASHVGLFIGMVAGIRGGVVDKTLMFLTDTFVVIPQLPLLVVLAMLLKEYMTFPLMALLISITSWPWPARQVRAMILSLREREYISVAYLSGMGTSKILLTEIMPHVFGWHLINATNTVLYAIGAEVGLAILGLSILQEDTLGTMIYWSIMSYGAFFRGIWWWVVPPIIVFIVLFTSLYLISVGISEHLDPKLRRWFR